MIPRFSPNLLSDFKTALGKTYSFFPEAGLLKGTTHIGTSAVLIMGYSLAATGGSGSATASVENVRLDTPVVQQALDDLDRDSPEVITAFPDQFQVNSSTTEVQIGPDVAMDSDGDFVIVWTSDVSESADPDTDGTSIQGQLYNSSGTKIGPQFQVNTYATGNQEDPRVAMDSHGDFVVVWTSLGSADSDNSYNSIQGQRFFSSGYRNGSQFQVNTYTESYQSSPDVAIDNDGDFIVAWQSFGSFDVDKDFYSIQAQRYNSSGVKQDTQFQVNSYTPDLQTDPSVAMDSAGNFVVTWRSNGSNFTDDSGSSIQAQRYNSNGAKQDNQFQVNTYITGVQWFSSVAMDADGDFVVVWESSSSNYGDSDWSVQGQRFNSVGVAEGSQFQVNTHTTGDQVAPSVAMDSNGDFVVVWESEGSYGTDSLPRSIQAQRYTNNGGEVGSEFQVNTYTIGSQFFTAAAMDSFGNFLVSWTSEGSVGDDDSSFSIQARYFYNTRVAAIQYQVNSYTSNNQTNPAVAMDSSGNFVVVWGSDGSFGSDDSSYSIQGQRYDSDGGKRGSQFQVNTYTADFQGAPAVAMDSEGDFVVVWNSNGSIGDDNLGYSIQGQRYNKDGGLEGPQFQVNSFTSGGQYLPSVAMDGDGDFVVVWISNGSIGDDNLGYSIQGQRYNSSGVAIEGQFQVNTYTIGSQATPAVEMDSDGDFVVVWRSDASIGDDDDGFSIQGQRYNKDSGSEGPQFQVNSITTSNQLAPAIGMDNEGDFVVVWASVSSGGDDDDITSVQGQRFNNSGTVGPQFQINSYTINSQEFPDVAMDSDGDFSVVWHSLGSDETDVSSFSIQGRRYNKLGVAQSDQFQVNIYTSSAQTRPAVAMDSVGDFVVAWRSDTSNYGDTSSRSIQLRRFTADHGQLPINQIYLPIILR